MANSMTNTALVKEKVGDGYWNSNWRLPRYSVSWSCLKLKSWWEDILMEFSVTMLYSMSMDQTSHLQQ